MRLWPVWLAALWWGSLTTLGFFVVPMLFANLPTPAMAGNMAAKLFTAQTYISAVSGLLILLAFRSNRSIVSADRAGAATIFVVAGVLLAMLVEFAVAPRIVARDNLALWHGVASTMYLVQWMCAGVVLGKLVQSGTASVAAMP
ncbi:MAG: hypothetical protein CFE44_14135 [Burkholderiales bacterium PBB4]|nr:MAG: hypothetical protein CFE44_14135 [Burkholderiales bacterium PBB4]